MYIYSVCVFYLYTLQLGSLSLSLSLSLYIYTLRAIIILLPPPVKPVLTEKIYPRSWDPKGMSSSA